MDKPTGAPERQPHPSQEDEALRQARAAEGRLAELDKATFAAASYVKPPGTGRRDVAVTMSRVLGR